MTEQLREDLDTFAEEHGYTGRSEVIREACHSLLEEYQESDYEDRRVLATVTAVFGYDEPEIERRMMDIRHEFEGSIRSNSHNCLQENAGCVETFVVEAAYQDVLHFVGTVRGADESVSVEYTVVPVDRNGIEASDT
ncbi:nickel-responsive transcriptional regulator NikR [Halorubrum ezzemoulense]|jgi:CopG family nickel-responsive transcriptional regulator|uniref:Nickel-responsive transcriptional regulator NikR n=1 Tax=Halorubrum ezzemoulense TaxID=337243 RepID=A0A256JMH1_HALEZ|nr:nickel-responsive transcriptional regulator NikR [Halorubrum ezzemoulense]MDB2226102.1 nickel-responsive transcriptional regulator NikR [Halorubrum ezzemoulense]MDB2265557.1 nickel-responsive transcriptional regulator NikR [Halorubrum ezzemoulense]MDB9250550.1 nickel-responsive transcriptional regulator NikR [Halorubrum ezzemoulense]MDB9260665.1 nickel-responsive transcriptional regulator NikR [Halorubrum ezzemoulense]MDB9264053.1 nickel-responsive transcriptional regulator NikR [Halorubrum